MSGICGIVNAAGAAVDSKLLRELTASLGYRAPDGQDSRIDGCAGLGHALLRTGGAAALERQPCSLDGETWITADARIDGQRELKEKLAAKGRGRLAEATDAELILHAYHAWGEDCVKHLIGDFAFAVWDGPRRRLFCARDHFGVKPFFFAALAQELVFSNTLQSVRAHPGVAARLDELAIADFLLFEMNQDPAGTAFAAIRRLPAAHCLSYSAGGLRIVRYWSLPAEVEVRHLEAEEHVERFRELLRAAVADRLRSDRVAIMMSGGLDSSTVAAVAVEEMRARHSGGGVHAFTSVYDSLIPDRERFYSGLAAARLGIPIAHHAADEYGLYERYHELGTYFQEPDNDPHAAIYLDATREAAAYARVALTGWDGDGLLTESPRRYFRSLLRSRRWGRLIREAPRYAIAERKLVPARRGNAARAAQPPPFPDWLDAELVKRLDLRARWAQIRAAPTHTHGMRPNAHHILGYFMRRSHFFDGYDPGYTGLALEVRHPLLDVRLVEYCLSLPPFPWCVRKEMLRRAMRGVLPGEVLERPKTPLAGFPYLPLLRAAEARWIDDMAFAPRSRAYFDPARIPRACAETDPDKAWANLRPRSLDLWLRSLTPYDVHRKEDRHEYA